MRRPVRRSPILAAVPGLLVILVLPPACIYRTSAHPRRARCASNLRQIGYACHLYAADHSDVFPWHQDTLFGEGYIDDPKVFDCPVQLRNHPNHPQAMRDDIPAGFPEVWSYIHVPGLRTDDPPHYVLAFDEEWNHDGDGINVLYVGGNVAWVEDIEAFHIRLQKQQAELTAAGRKMEVLWPWWSEYPDKPAYVGRPVEQMRPSALVVVLPFVAGLLLVVFVVLLIRAFRRQGDDTE